MVEMGSQCQAPSLCLTEGCKSLRRVERVLYMGLCLQAHIVIFHKRSYK